MTNIYSYASKIVPYAQHLVYCSAYGTKVDGQKDIYKSIQSELFDKLLLQNLIFLIKN